MFGVSFPEFVTIALVALFIFGPTRLPQVAKTVGKTIRSVRSYLAKAMDSLDEEAQTITAFASELSTLTPRGIATQVLGTPATKHVVTTASSPAVHVTFDPDAT